MESPSHNEIARLSAEVAKLTATVTELRQQVVKLSEAKPKTGVPHERGTTLWRHKHVKLFRFNEESKEWDAHGSCTVWLLWHETRNKVRLAVRHNETSKVHANHYVTVDMNFRPVVDSERSWMWKIVADAAQDTPVSKTMCARFSKKETAEEFKTQLDAAKAKILSNIKVSEQKSETSTPVLEPIKEEKSEWKSDSSTLYAESVSSTKPNKKQKRGWGSKFLGMFRLFGRKD